MGGIIDIMINSDITVPIHEVLILMMILSGCLFARATKFGLMISYLFTFQLGARFFLEYFEHRYFPYVYIFCAFGLVVFILGLYLIFTDNK